MADAAEEPSGSDAPPAEQRGDGLPVKGERDASAESPAAPAGEGFDPRTIRPLGDSGASESPPEPSSPRKGGLKGRVKRGLVSMAAATYDARADDLQLRAVAAMREALQEETERIIEVAIDSYDRRADDLEERAVRAIRKVLEEETERFREVAQSTYDARADDLEDRAVRALRRAMVEETRRIRSTIERSVQAKRREVRLSLLVLVLANLLYLVVYWATTGFD